MTGEKSKKSIKSKAKKTRGYSVFGSIRWKLMLFAILLCAVVTGLIWLMNVQLLVPTYNRNIETSLEQTAQKYKAIIEKYGVIEDPLVSGYINEDFYEEINAVAAEDTELAGKCLDISGADGTNLLHMHQLGGNCLLHPVHVSVFGMSNDTINWDTSSTQKLRLLILRDGDGAFTLVEGDKEQRVVAKNIDDNYTLFISTDLARIDEAAGIIQSQMPFIVGAVLIVGIIGAFLFSRHFSKPLSSISNAARRVATGDLRARASVEQNDELGALASDFNIMADEIARTAQLQRDLTANISHDLRTPLTLIKGYAETIRDLTGSNKDKREEQLNVIIDETDRLSSLVSGVMELSKVTSGSQKSDILHFDMAQLCEETAFLYDDMCKRNGYKLEINTPEECMVYADPGQMSRVIHNLLANAIHHIGEDNTIIINCAPLPNGDTRVEISDHGEGIAPEDLPYIFDKYYRSRASSGKVGTGLGLSITKAILQNHAFAYGVESCIGKGSTFWFTVSGAPKEIK